MEKKTLLAVGICLMLYVAIAAGDKNKSITVTGWVSDEACGAAHTKPGREDCVRKCLKGGADIGHPEWKPQRMVFVTDTGQKIWVVENPEALKGHEGHHLKITGQVDTSKKTVHVNEVNAL